MCMYVYVRTYVCMRAHTVYTVHMYVRMCDVCMCTYVCTFVCVCMYVCTYVRMYVCLYVVSTYIRTYVRTCNCTYVHVGMVGIFHMYVYVCVVFGLCHCKRCTLMYVKY